MSLLSREEHHILLCHDRIMLTTRQRKLALRRMRRDVLREQVLPVDATAGEAPWHGPLKALEAALPGMALRNPHVTVTLSNHFAHYALIPESEALSNAEEEMAFAQHIFREMYGNATSAWDLRISRIDYGKGGMAQLACAVDARLLEGLRGLFGSAGIRVHSIRPHLMEAYNSCRALLRNSTAWFVIAEHANLCLALLLDGQWLWVRTIRTGAGWREKLPLLLEREELICNIDATIKEVFLWAPYRRDDSLPSSSRWQFRYLHRPHTHSLAAGPSKQTAMRLNG